MGINYHTLKSWPFPPIEQTYTERDTIIYALGVGCGQDPLDTDALNLVYEPALVAMPSMAAVLGFPGNWMKDPLSGIDYVKVVHGEQSVRIHQLLPNSGTVIGYSRVKSLIDKGSGKGALVLIERLIYEKETSALLATVEQLNFCRGDGGFSENDQPSDPAPSPGPAMPTMPPDHVCDISTRPESAALYRLCGDYNPLHMDPAVARAAGFERPILHGLATYGIATHAVLKTLCNYQTTKVSRVSARFSSPVFPGETIRTEFWRGQRDADGKEEVRFRARVLGRDKVVLDNGRAYIR